MTERSRPWDGTTTGDAFEAPYDAATEWARVMRATAFGAEITANKGGVLMDATGFNDFSVTTPAANTARVQTGIGLNQGTWYESDANIDFTIPTPAVSTRIDRIVLRKSWASQTVRMARIAGVEGAGVPAVTQSFGVTWDVPLWQVSIVITTGTITYLDERRGIGAGHAHTISLQVDSGNMGVGVAPVGNQGIGIGGTINASAGQAMAMFVGPSLVAQANNDSLYGVYIVPAINLNGKTGVGVAGLMVAGNTYGNAPTAYGVRIFGPTGTGQTNITLQLEGPGNGSVQNSYLVMAVGWDWRSTGDMLCPAITTTATDGFPYIPTNVGPPTGVPTNRSGNRSPLYFDSSNHKLWVYENSTTTWKGVVVA